MSGTEFGWPANGRRSEAMAKGKKSKGKGGKSAKPGMPKSHISMSAKEHERAMKGGKHR
jgi:hypothetical protein